MKYALPALFAAFGIGFFAIASVPMLLDWSSAHSWKATDAYIQDANLKTNKLPNKEKTQTVTARYIYNYLGNSYHGQRIGLSDIGGNNNSYHKSWYQRLQRHKHHQIPITVWVNPDNPNHAVIDRDISWVLVLIPLFFLIIFGGIGIGNIIYIWRADNNAKPLINHQPNKPWLSYRQWAEPTILSNAKVFNKSVLIFAICWNTLSLGLIFMVISAIIQSSDIGRLYLLLGSLTLPAIGAFFIYYWHRNHKQYQRIGPMPLTLDPYPASIGGECGGTIELSNEQLKSAKVSLQCFDTYRQRQEIQIRILWEDAQIVHWQHKADNLNIAFCFELPQYVPLPDLPSVTNGKQWRLRLTAILNDGTQIDRDYNDLPVFNTQQRSEVSDTVKELSKSTDALRLQRKLVDSVLPIQLGAKGYELNYPAYQQSMALIFSIIGTLTVYFGISSTSLTANITFLLLGGTIAITGLAWFATSLSITFGRDGITTKTTIFGIVKKPKFLPSYAFKKFDKKITNITGIHYKTVQYYSIEAHSNDGQKIVVAQNLEGLLNVKAAIEKLTELTKY